MSDDTVGSFLKRNGTPPAPERGKTTTWNELIRSHVDVPAATDFFTTEVGTTGGFVDYWFPFFVIVSTRKTYVAGLTPHPNAMRNRGRVFGRGMLVEGFSLSSVASKPIARRAS